eukprot:SAG31_NODE_3907_length_3763_cov_18.329421_4_plen_47_part_00
MHDMTCMLGRRRRAVVWIGSRDISTERDPRELDTSVAARLPPNSSS